MTDEEFFYFCQQNPDMKFERTASKQIIFMAPTTADTGNQNFNLSGEFYIWNRKEKLGYLFDSDSGFTLPNSAVRSPDISWIEKEKWEEFSIEDKQSFTKVCPDFVLELMSKSDSFNDTKNKMVEYIENGAKLGWLVNPKERKTFIFKPESETRAVSFDEILDGEEVLKGFTLQVSEIIK